MHKECREIGVHANYSPPWPRGGGCAIKKISRSDPSLAQTGAQREGDSAKHQEWFVQASDNRKLEPTTPSAPNKEASRHLLEVASTPPWLRRGISSGAVAALLKRIDNETQLVGIGLDIETTRDVRPEAARFFLTESEREWLKGQPDITSSKTLLRLWTVKEALFKADPDNGEKIIGEYVLDEPSAWAGSAYRRDCTSLQFHYTSMLMDDGFLSIAISAKGDRNA